MKQIDTIEKIKRFYQQLLEGVTDPDIAKKEVKDRLAAVPGVLTDLEPGKTDEHIQDKINVALKRAHLDRAASDCKELLNNGDFSEYHRSGLNHLNRAGFKTLAEFADSKHLRDSEPEMTNRLCDVVEDARIELARECMVLLQQRHDGFFHMMTVGLLHDARADVSALDPTKPDGAMERELREAHEAAVAHTGKAICWAEIVNSSGKHSKSWGRNGKD